MKHYILPDTCGIVIIKSPRASILTRLSYVAFITISCVWVPLCILRRYADDDAELRFFMAFGALMFIIILAAAGMGLVSFFMLLRQTTGSRLGVIRLAGLFLTLIAASPFILSIISILITA